ncbi:hypothetical protein [Dysgonomonas sp. 511]|uniref:hypothetical protein n=1 Tax=Dysgonomonas sp. 511 TaxID=2302930 RepID=UPI0013D6EE0C|nr:hypothetical protein [Dysgonomonas sp. 511]NDV80282.1 hypothetical protein [Dysgonomonas sp. 511]
MIRRKVIKNIHALDLIESASYNVSCIVVEDMDLRFEHFQELLNIENCIIENLQLDATWFLQGLIFKNNIVKNTITYEMGGHNKEIISFERNIFCGFFHFLDCHFENKVIFRDNIFEEGSNLLGNRGKGFQNTFTNGIIVENNIGDIGKE